MSTRGSWFRPGILYPLLAVLGLLPVLPLLIKGSPVLNNDMLVAYFCYFWDFHQSWSWESPLVFWSSSYQTGMPMYAYWQSGYLYPLTWLLFGPVSPHVGMPLFYAAHFALGIFGFLRLGPRLGLHRPASLWAGIAFSLSGTVLARYEHATFLSGWAWMPLALSTFLALRDGPGVRNLFLYAGAITLQALGGHPQASATTAVLIGLFTLAGFFRPGPRPNRNPDATSKPRRAAWILGGHALALLYCAPLALPFLDLVDRTNRFDGAAWEGQLESDPTRPAAPKAEEISAGQKLEDGVFGFEKFSTGGMRPLHLLSLGAAHALGSPSNATWWGGEVWGEVFLYMGALGLFFCFFASWKRAGPDMRLLWLIGGLGLWLAFGAHLGASQILYHVPVFNNFRRPARFLILFVFALAALSGHGFQRWTGKPRGRGLPAWLGAAGLVAAALLLALRLMPGANAALLDVLQSVKHLDPAKDYGGKIAALAGRLAVDALMVALSGLALAWAAMGPRTPMGAPGRAAGGHRSIRMQLLFALLILDLLRIHWDHFYLFPSSFYREPPATVAALDASTQPFWRVSHYLQYPGTELWRMHNHPLASMELLDREKSVLSHGIHAVFGYRHTDAHLPLVWKWEEGLANSDKSGRYLLSNRALAAYAGDSLREAGRFGEVRVYEVRDWRPRFERIPERAGYPDSTSCPGGFAGFRGLCVREARDGHMEIRGDFAAGDTLLVRERAYPGWRFRIDGGPWREARETPDHFLYAPVARPSRSVELAFVPTDFYRWVGAGALVSIFIAVFAVFRRRIRPERA